MEKQGRGRPKKEVEIKKVVKQVEKSVKEKRKPVSVVEFIPSGSTWLDLALGGGFPVGKVVNVVGNNSTGKTLLSCEVIYNAILKFGKDEVDYFFADSEVGLTFNTKQLYGYELLELEESPYTVEQLEASLVRFMERGLLAERRLVYIEDSLDGLTCRQEEKRSVDRIEKTLVGKRDSTGTYGAEKAKFMSSLFRRFKDKFKNSKCLFLITSQIRDDIASSFNTSKRSGGRALDFYASQIIWLSKIEDIIKKGVPIGVVVKADVRKNKVGIPFRKAYFYILFDYGIDNIPGNIDYLFDLRTETGRGRSRVDMEWDGEIFKTKESLIKYIQEKDQEELLASMVQNKWYKFEEEIKPNRKKKY